MKAVNKAARLQGRIADYERTLDSIKGNKDGYHKPGAGANSFGHQGPGKKATANRVKRTQVVHQHLRDLAKANPQQADLRRYL